MSEIKATCISSDKSGKIVWVDVLRLVAILMVIICHVNDSFSAPAASLAADNPLKEVLTMTACVYGSLVRACVPLFVAITGMLLLPIKDSPSVFYKKRLSRIVAPFLIWAFVYNLIPYITAQFSVDYVRVLFPWITEPNQTWEMTVKAIALIPVNFYDNVTLVTWYIYMLIGLYLIMPVFSAWVEKATRNEKFAFLCAWSITLFLPYVQVFYGPIWGECSWNKFQGMYYFSGFIGYLLLGHYVATYIDWSWKKTLAVAIPSFTVGYIITLIGTYHMYGLPSPTLDQLELFWTFCSVNVALMTISVFLVCKKITISSPFVCRILHHISACGLGIFLIHYAILGPFCREFLKLGWHPAAVLPVVVVIGFFISWGIISVVKLLPKSKYIIG